MINTILLTVAVIFAALGICDFIHTVKAVFLYSGVKTENYCIIFLKRGSAIAQLRFFSYKLRWYGDEFCKRIIAVSDDIDSNEYAACEKFCYGENIYLCEFNAIPSLINSLSTGETDVC